MIKVNYFQTWFFLDLIAALPFDVLHAFSDLMVSWSGRSRRSSSRTQSIKLWRFIVTAYFCYNFDLGSFNFFIGICVTRVKRWYSHLVCVWYWCICAVFILSENGPDLLLLRSARTHRASLMPLRIATIFPSPWYLPPFPSPFFFSSAKKVFSGCKYLPTFPSLCSSPPLCIRIKDQIAHLFRLFVLFSV